jgi:electron transfer flavoprotein beta subunit
MKILVTLKRVVDPEVKLKIGGDGKSIAQDNLKWVINPFDEIAVEEAIRLRDAGLARGAGQAEVIVVSVGPSDVATQLRTALAMGADRAIQIVHAGEIDSDGVARLFQKVYEQEKPDLVLMGKLSVDNDAWQAGPLLAEYLGLPQATFASKNDSLESDAEKNKVPGILIEGTTATVVREADGGLETLKVQLPAVVTTDLRLNMPRYPSLPNIMKAKKKEIKEHTPESLGVDVTPKVKVLKLEVPPARKAGVKVADAAELLSKLRTEAKVI